MTLSRRRFTALAVSAPIWVTPVVMSVQTAGASGLNSKPPVAPPPINPDKPVNPAPQMGAPLATGLPGSLPFTGQNVVREAEVAAAALVAGAAVVAVTHRPKREAL